MYPTLLKLSGASLEQPLPIDGKDAWPTIAKDKLSPHEEILLNCTPFHGAIRKGDWKLIHNGHLDLIYLGLEPAEQKYELFNLADDPSEKNNIIDKYPEKFEELKKRLQIYRNQSTKPYITPNKMPKDFKVPKDWNPAHKD